jgi:hypothetical protein
LPSNPEPQETERKQTSKRTNKQNKQTNKQTNKQVRKGQGKGSKRKGKGKGKHYFGSGSLTRTSRQPQSSVLHNERRCQDRVYFSVQLLNVSECAFCCFVAGSLQCLQWRSCEGRCGAACGRPAGQP